MNKIRKVILNDRNGKGYKYIFAEVTEKDGTVFEIIRGYADQLNHSGIVIRTENEVRALYPNAKVECKGGGRVIFPEPKTLVVYGSSLDYGYPPLDKVELILRENFPELKVVVSNKIKLEEIEF